MLSDGDGRHRRREAWEQEAQRLHAPCRGADNDQALVNDAHFYRAGQAASAERIKALEEEVAKALAKANKPRWFYYADDEGSPFDSVQDAVQAMVDELGPEDYLPNGTQVLRIDTLRDCAPIYAAVRFLSEAEREARDDGFLFDVTECATYAEAEALLKEADQ